jgi:hypothetical protein
MKKYSSIEQFIELSITENRLKKGFSYFKKNNIKIDFKATGHFLEWIVRSVLEEKKDALEASGFDKEKVKNAIVTKACTWFLNQLNIQK